MLKAKNHLTTSTPHLNISTVVQTSLDLPPPTMNHFDRVLSLDMTQGPTLDTDSLYQSPEQEMLGPCRQWMPDVYSISSERLIRLVFGEGHATGQHV